MRFLFWNFLIFYSFISWCMNTLPLSPLGLSYLAFSSLRVNLIQADRKEANIIGLKSQESSSNSSLKGLKNGAAAVALKRLKFDNFWTLESPLSAADLQQPRRAGNSIFLDFKKVQKQLQQQQIRSSKRT
uniref:Uncharacterized protein n=2 Tax=Solanum tuberosum TaxID=4113 RepID=M1BWW6_SOLTU